MVRTNTHHPHPRCSRKAHKDVKCAHENKELLCAAEMSADSASRLHFNLNFRVRWVNNPPHQEKKSTCHQEQAVRVVEPPRRRGAPPRYTASSGVSSGGGGGEGEGSTHRRTTAGATRHPGTTLCPRIGPEAADGTRSAAEWTCCRRGVKERPARRTQLSTGGRRTRNCSAGRCGFFFSVLVFAAGWGSSQQPQQPTTVSLLQQVGNLHEGTTMRSVEVCVSALFCKRTGLFPSTEVVGGDKLQGVSVGGGRQTRGGRPLNTRT